MSVKKKVRRKCLDKGKSLLAVLIKGSHAGSIKIQWKSNIYSLVTWEKLENIALYVKVTWGFKEKQLAKVVGKQDKKPKTLVEDIIYFIFPDTTSGSLN